MNARCKVASAPQKDRNPIPHLNFGQTDQNERMSSVLLKKPWANIKKGNMTAVFIFSLL
jgi:hypothetical protein